MKFTPDIKFVNDEMLNEFVVTVERRNVGETDAKNDRDNDRDDRDKRDEEGRDNSLSSKCIENNEAVKRDKDGVEETEDGARVVRTPYKQLPSVQKDIIQFCAIPRTAKEIMDHIGYYNNSKNMTTYVRPLLEMGYLEMTEPEEKTKRKRMIFGKKIKELREEHGMVQRKLAAALDIDTPMYSKIERGERKAKRSIFAISDVKVNHFSS